MPRLHGDRVDLREFREEDVPIIHGWTNDSTITRYLSWGVFPQTRRETERFVEAQMNAQDPLNRAFVIALRDGDACVGTTGCHNIDWRSRSAELGIVIGKPELLGKGLGTEAMELLLLFSFRELNLHRLYLRVFDFNERAIASYRKCGFREEGRLREALFREGRYHDILIMGLLEEEFHERRQGTSAE